MKKINFMNGVEQYEGLLAENNISIVCNENMEMEISDADAAKLQSLINCNEFDITIE